MDELKKNQTRINWIAVVAILTCLLWLTFALHLRFGGSAFRNSIPWPEAFGEAARNTLVWCALALVGSWLARRIPIDGAAWKSKAAIHILLAGLMTGGCTALSVGIARLFTNHLGIPVFTGPPPSLRTRASRGFGHPDDFMRPDFRGGPMDTRSTTPPPFAEDEPLPPWLEELLGPETNTSQSRPAGNVSVATAPSRPRSSGPPFSVLLRLTAAKRGLQFLMGYLVVIGLVHAWTYHRRSTERERRAGRLAAQLTEARLQALQMQLNPHFLFNALHAISTLVYKDAKKANDMITVLSDFLRMSLVESKTRTHEIPLADEIDFLKHYLEIEKIRFGDRLKIDWLIDDDTLDAHVPIFILQPLVENAFRHGIEQRAKAGNLTIECQRQAERISLSVADDGVAMTPDQITRIADGIGLANVRSRLRTLYQDDARISMEPTGPYGLKVTLTVPCHDEPVFSPPENAGASPDQNSHR